MRFEIWRDKLRLRQTRSERQALEILLRMAAGNHLWLIQDDDYYSSLERLVDQYLPTPALRSDSNVDCSTRAIARSMNDAERREVALERANRGDARGMLRMPCSPTACRARIRIET